MTTEIGVGFHVRWRRAALRLTVCRETLLMSRLRLTLALRLDRLGNSLRFLGEIHHGVSWSYPYRCDDHGVCRSFLRSASVQPSLLELTDLWTGNVLGTPDDTGWKRARGRMRQCGYGPRGAPEIEASPRHRARLRPEPKCELSDTQIISLSQPRGSNEGPINANTIPAKQVDHPYPIRGVQEGDVEP